MCRYASDKVFIARPEPGRFPSWPTTEPQESEPTAPSGGWRGWAAAGVAALLGAGTVAGVAYGQPFGGAVLGNPPAFELAPVPVCNENMLEGISYEVAGVKRYLVLPESTPQVWYLLGISITTGLDAGVSISAVDCSLIAVDNAPAMHRPYCRHLPNPGPLCVGINVGPATRN